MGVKEKAAAQYGVLSHSLVQGIMNHARACKRGLCYEIIMVFDMLSFFGMIRLYAQHPMERELPKQ